MLDITGALRRADYCALSEMPRRGAILITANGFSTHDLRIGA
jgi:hypothetical protein